MFLLKWTRNGARSIYGNKRKLFRDLEIYTDELSSGWTLWIEATDIQTQIPPIVYKNEAKISQHATILCLWHHKPHPCQDTHTHTHIPAKGGASVGCQISIVELHSRTAFPWKSLRGSTEQSTDRVQRGQKWFEKRLFTPVIGQNMPRSCWQETHPVRLFFKAYFCFYLPSLS